VADGREGEGGADFGEEGDGAWEEGDGGRGGRLDGAEAAAAGHGEVEVLAAGEHGLEPCAVVADERAEGLEAEGLVEWEAVDGGGDHGGVGAVGCGGAEEELEEALEDAAAAVFRCDGEETRFAPAAVWWEVAFEVWEFEGEGERRGEADGEHADDSVAAFGDEVEVGVVEAVDETAVWLGLVLGDFGGEGVVVELVDGFEFGWEVGCFEDESWGGHGMSCHARGRREMGKGEGISGVARREVACRVAVLSSVRPGRRLL
jgi:hypothetical protein